MTSTARRGRIPVVAIIDHLVPFGGAEILVAAIAKRLDAERFESIVCATRTVDPAVRADLEAHGVEVIQLARSRRARLDQWWPLLRLIRSRRVAIVHAHKFGSNVWVSILRRFQPIPAVIAHEHVWSFEGSPLRRLLDRLLVARTADVVLTVSEHTRDRMVAIERLPRERIRVFTHGVERPSSTTAQRAELGLAEDEFVVGVVCVLRPQKAVENVLEAAASLRARLPRLRVVVVGDGPERARLEALRGELGLGAVVTFLGHRADVSALLPIFDVCVSSSRFEGSPLAVMECMAAGRAIVATAVGGVPELVEDGVSGLLVPPNDPRALAAGIARLAAEPALRAELGRAAATRQREHFDLEQNVRKLEALYEELVARSDASGARRSSRGQAALAGDTL